MENVKDIDGNSYKTVKIGNQIWMAENLKVTRYRNGDKIRYFNFLDTGTESGKYANYNDNFGSAVLRTEKYVSIYGRLYNYFAVHDSQNIAPEGWHVSTRQEWKDLETYLDISIGVNANDGGKKLKEFGFDHWLKRNDKICGTNESGFTALPGGNCDYWKYKHYNNLGETAGFWL